MKDKTLKGAPKAAPASASVVAPTPLPLSLGEGDPKKLWREYFSKNNPKSALVTDLVVRLHEAKRDLDVIAVIEAAILNGQTQSWMYEILAAAMQMTGRPQKDVERVLLSGVDFTAVDVPNMMFSAAYLTRYGLRSRALTLYRQASSLAPWRAEPYVLGLKLAREAADVDALEWAAVGIYSQAWVKDYQSLQVQAGEAVAEARGLLKKSADPERKKQFEERIAEARRRDLVLRLSWNGTADLDLVVEEPLGTVCSPEQKFTRGGGVLVHDGVGPRPDDAYELYVCPQAASGDYRVTIRYVFGNVVAKQAKLVIIRYEGTAYEEKTQQVVALTGNSTSLKLSLNRGRRTDLSPPIPEELTGLQRSARRPAQTPGQILQAAHAEGSSGPRRPSVQQAELVRQRDVLLQNLGGFQSAVQPVVQTLSEGVTLGATAIVSPDRRYVRLGLAPTFSAITDVFTFTFAGPGAGATNGGNR